MQEEKQEKTKAKPTGEKKAEEKMEVPEKKEEEKSEEKKAKPRKRYESIEDLPGIGSTSAAKLKEAGYDSVETLAYSMPSELSEVGGIGQGTAVKIINLCRQAVDMGFESGTDVMRRREKVEKITTGSKELDALIGGGAETQAVTETYGKFGSGKSQLGFQLCVNVQAPRDQGGLEGSCIFVDTEGTFRPERMKQMAEAKGLDPAKVLKSIHVARAYNSDHQMLLAEKSEELLKDKTKNIKLIVVDSLTGAFRSDYLGRGALAERQQNLNKHTHLLLRFAERYNVAVYVTNQVMDRPDILFGDPTTPIGGHVLAHTSTYRLYLRRSKEDRRIAKLVDSPCLPDGECVFAVREEGVTDA